VLATQSLIDGLAKRIERAYRLRRPGRKALCLNWRVWEVAAVNLIEIREADPTVPLDPELYVAAQPTPEFEPDPWREVTGADAANRYIRQVRAIVKSLRMELMAEIDRAERLVENGEELAKVIDKKSARLSPLARIIVAHRAGRPELAAAYRDAAAGQHLGCPLYREACRTLLAPDAYPTPPVPLIPSFPAPARRTRTQQSHLN